MVAASGSPPFHAVFDDHSLFAWDFGRVVRVDLASGTATTIYDIQAPGAIGSGDRGGMMAIDDAAVYSATDYTGDGPPFTAPRHYIDRVNKDGSGAVTLFSSTNLGNGIVVTGDSVYFDDGGTLYRRCKR
jgi:hypothetical protein